MAIRGPRRGTVNNPKGINQWSNGQSPNTSAADAIKRVQMPGTQYAAKRNEPSKVRFGNRGYSGVKASGSPTVSAGPIAADAPGKVSVAKGGLGSRIKGRISHAVTRGRIKARNFTRAYRNSDTYSGGVKDSVVAARNKVKSKMVAGKSNRYASGSGDKSKKGVAYKTTRARIKARGLTRGARTYVRKPGNLVEKYKLAKANRQINKKI